MSASTPPVYGAVPAPEQKKNWFARHKLLTALLAIVVIAIIGAALSKQSDGKPAATSSSQAADSAASGNAADKADKKADAEGDKGEKNDDATVGIGTPVILGDFEVTATNVEQGVAHIGDANFGKDASGQFVIVNVTVKNTGKEAEGFSESDQKLVDTAGRQHSVSGDSWYLGDEAMIFEKINPGNTITGKLLFDVPADAVPAKLEMATGWTHKATINLQ